MINFVIPSLRDPEGFMAKIREMARRPDGESFDLLELKDGRVFERYSKPQRIGEKCVGRVWSIRDITERKKAEETLRRTEELYRRAIAGAGAVPYAYDYETRTYLFMGEGIKELIGYESWEMTQDVWVKIVQESIMGGETSGLDKAQAARRVTDGELRNWRCDMRVITREGKTRWLSDASVQNVDELGRPIGSMGILQDMTERKQAEITALAFSKLGERLSSAATPAQAARAISENADELFGWDAFWLKLYTAETDTMHSMLSVDSVGGQRVREEWTGNGRPTAMHRRVMEKGAELILRDSPRSILPGAIAFGDASRPSASIMLAPIRYGTKVVGILSAQSYRLRAYTQRELVTLQALADQCGGALERIRADEELEQAHRQLLDISRRAGMAEVASNVLHNVGNVLNSVNISAALLADRIRSSKISSLVKAMALMQQHSNDLGAFLSEDPKGRQLPGFLSGVIEYLTEEQKALLKELDSLGKNIEHIKDIVAMQQNYAKVSGLSETITPAELIEDALRMNEAAFALHQVQVIREYGDVPPITVEKHKVLQILVNLMRNAKYALEEGGKKEKPIRLRLERKNGEAIQISVTDYGVGIPTENLTRIFHHGFTTRRHGHGFGLHSGALAARELGGSLSVHSDGPGTGATFTLELPLLEPKKAGI